MRDPLSYASTVREIGVRTESGASRFARHRGPRRRVSRRAVLGHTLGLYRAAHLVRRHDRYLLAVYRLGRRGLERVVAHCVPLPVELRPWRRGAGRAHTRLGIQPGPHPRPHDRLDDGGVSLRLSPRRAGQPVASADLWLARDLHRRRRAGAAPLLRPHLHAGIGALSGQPRPRRRGRTHRRRNREEGRRRQAAAARAYAARRARENRSRRHRRAIACARAPPPHHPALDRVVLLSLVVERHHLHAARRSSFSAACR